MKDNTIILLTAELVCGALGVAAMIVGNNEVAIAAVTAAGALLGGHLNGAQGA